WRELMTAFPEQPFAPPAPLLREVTRFDTPADLRVDRWSADIADAVEKLRHYAPGHLADAARTAAAEDTADPGERGPRTDAHWIRAALAAHAEGVPAGPAAPATDPRQAEDQEGEVAWLVRVAAACRTIPAARTTAVLAAARAGEAAATPNSPEQPTR
ncbi:DUF6545 domain-containing protein, partial [Streptomyces albidoflavus]